MIIRPEQLEAFQSVADRVFVRQMVEYLRENHAGALVYLPDGSIAVEQIPDEILYEMVRNGIARARSYGLSWESTVGAFVVLMIVIAPNFDEHPLIQRILTDESVPENDRIDELWGRTSEQNWEAAEKSYDANAWNLKHREMKNEQQ